MSVYTSALRSGLTAKIAIFSLLLNSVLLSDAGFMIHSDKTSGVVTLFKPEGKSDSLQLQDWLRERNMEKRGSDLKYTENGRETV